MTNDFLLPLAFIFLFFLIMFFILKKQKKDFAILKAHYHGSYSIFGSLSFQVRNFRFILSKVGTQNVNSGIGGSYSQLLLETSHPFDFFLGPLEGYKYISIGSVPKDYLSLQIGQNTMKREFILKTEDASKSTQFKRMIESDRDLQLKISELLAREFQYIRFISRIELVGFLFQKKAYFQLSFLPHNIYDHPEVLDSHIQKFIDVLEKLAIKI